MLPGVDINQLDGQMGALPAGSPLLAIIGTAEKGPVATPAVFSRTADLLATHGVGSGPEAVAFAIQAFGRPVLFLNTGKTTAGAYGLVAVEDDAAVNAALTIGAGNAAVTYTAVSAGSGGNDIRVRHVVSGNDTALTVVVDGLDITVNVATNGGGEATSTASEVATAVNGEGAAAALVTAEAGGTGASVVAAQAYTNLSGGLPTVSGDSTDKPHDDYEIYIEFVTGTVITGGTADGDGTYRWSLDGGRTLSAVTALGAANELVIAEANVNLNLGDGTIGAGTIIRCRTSAPAWNNTQLGEALTALRDTGLNWEAVFIVGGLDGTSLDVLTAAFAHRRFAEKWFLGHFRVPNEGESEAAYAAAFEAAFASKATTYGAVAAGAGWVTSGYSYRSYLRSIAFVAAPFCARLSEEQMPSWLGLGSLPGISIRDENGNPLHHDEEVHGALDDLRALTLRTFDGRQGVYINLPRLLSSAGSDFRYLQHRRVFNLARRALRVYFEERLSAPITVNGETGFILEEEAVTMENGAEAAMAALLGAKPKASAWGVTVSRLDNILSTEELTVQAFVVPFGYPTRITIDLGFRNPTLVTV